MDEVVFLVEEAIEGGYNARTIADSIFTQGNNLEELKANVKDAVECHFNENDMPKVIRLYFMREEVITV